MAYQLIDRPSHNGSGQPYSIIIASPSMRNVHEQIARIAASDASVLILGETGVGKELVARELHHLSGRRGKFVPVNCTGIPEGLLESIMFGYVKGAYTGAYRDTEGKFEYAHNGTIFLDEVSEMGYPLQGKLLRVLQDKTIVRIGDNAQRRIDARVVSASNRVLRAEVIDGKFRDDLFYRLNVVPIKIPPLRDRREEIPGFVEHYLSRYCASENKRLQVSEDALKKLKDYGWPGNVRELENFIRKAVLLRGVPIPKEQQHLEPQIPGKVERQGIESAILQPDDVDLFLADDFASDSAEIRTLLRSLSKQVYTNIIAKGVPLNQAMDTLEKGVLEQSLEDTFHIQAEAARRLGVAERSVWHLVKKHKIDPHAKPRKD